VAILHSQFFFLWLFLLPGLESSQWLVEVLLRLGSSLSNDHCQEYANLVGDHRHPNGTKAGYSTLKSLVSDKMINTCFGNLVLSRERRGRGRGRKRKRELFGYHLHVFSPLSLLTFAHPLVTIGLRNYSRRFFCQIYLGYIGILHVTVYSTNLM
jgi:hypothetical protein